MNEQSMDQAFDPDSNYCYFSPWFNQKQHKEAQINPRTNQNWNLKRRKTVIEK